MKVGVFGLGSMGYGMATSLLKGGHEVWGFDIAAKQVEKFISDGGAGGDVAQVVPELDIVVLVVLNADQTESVLFGSNDSAAKGIVTHMKPSTTVVACATVAPEFARKMFSQCRDKGVSYLDAPISGGAIKAAQGKLSIMASGEQATFEKVRPVLDSVAETVFELGDEAGVGSAMKAVNQLLAGVHIASMAEAMTFGMSQGIEAAKIVDVISKCAGSSWMFENRAPHIVDGDYSPRSAVDIWLKDLGIVLGIADKAQFPTPLTNVALQQFMAASDSGLGKEDDAAVAKVYAQQAKIDLPKPKSS
jgi:3-hydroxyisobutyrate dehydrogenase-like beta-hydroxyacid dehydrogenase